jgi:protein-L-isoaspartate(D-aspartate) O-methyltransferase
MRKAREDMVERQLVARGIHVEAVLEAMREVPRERFVPTESSERAHCDQAVGIAAGQTISQPFIVARMSELIATLPEGSKVLEIGAGSGYQTAILVHMGFEVHAVEIVAELGEQARKRLAELGLSPASLTIADGRRGLAEHAPYDGVIAAAFIKRLPKSWVSQLAPEGIIVAPLGRKGNQTLCEWRLMADDKLQKRTMEPVRFVPLVRGRWL